MMDCGEIILWDYSIFHSVQAQITWAGGAAQASERNPRANGATAADGEALPWGHTGTASTDKKWSGENSPRARR